MKLSLINPDRIVNRITEFIDRLPREIPRVYKLPRRSISLPYGNFAQSYKSTDGKIVKLLDTTKYADGIEKIEYALEMLQNELVNYYEISQLCPDFFCKMSGYYYDPPSRQIAIIMDDCGIDLIDYAQENRLNNKEWISIFIQIAEAIQCLHSNGFVHLDLKPDNITINMATNKIKLIDAGSLTKLDGSCVKSTFGTVDYMPLNQRTHGCVRDERLKKFDIYALGVYSQYLGVSIFGYAFFKRILDINPDTRPNIEEVIAHLEGEYTNYALQDDRFRPRSIFAFGMPDRMELGGSSGPTALKTSIGKKSMKSRSSRGRRQKKRKTRR